MPTRRFLFENAGAIGAVGKKLSGTRAPRSFSHRHEASESESKNKSESEKERDRDRERERRERTPRQETPHSGHSKTITKTNVTQKSFQGVLFP